MKKRNKIYNCTGTLKHLIGIDDVIEDDKYEVILICSIERNNVIGFDVVKNKDLDDDDFVDADDVIEKLFEEM